MTNDTQLARVGNDNEHLEELKIKERERNLKERFDAIIESTAKFKLKIKPGKEWTFEDGDKTIYYVEEELKTKTDRELIAKCLSMVAESLYFELPDMEFISDEDKLGNPETLNHFFRLVNTTQAIRVEEMMMGDYNGTYDSFKYKFLKLDSEIDPALVGSLPRTVQYLYSLARQYWGEPPLNVMQEVKDALVQTENQLRQIYENESSYEAVKLSYEEVFPIYKQLIKEDEENPNPGNGGGSGGSGGGEPLPQELQKLINNSDTISMDEILDKMKELSKEELEKMKQASKGQQEEEQEGESNFGRNIEQEFDEQEKGGGNGDGQYGQRDPVLSNGAFHGHDEETLAKEKYMSYEQLYKEVYPYINTFAKKLSSIMKDNRYNRHGGGYRSGRLNTKKLYRRTTGSDKVFSRKIVRRHKDYAVTILIDESGSMTSDEKNRNAAKSACLFAEVLNKVGISFEIRAFNCSDRLYKSFHQKFGNKERRNIERIILNSHSYDAGGNNDGFAVNKASYHLNRYGDRDTERMLIVLSDGLPAPHHGSIPLEDAKRLQGKFRNYNEFNLHTEINKATQNAMVIGVGIKANHVRDYYENNALCNDVAQLPAIVLGRIKKNIRRG